MVPSSFSGQFSLASTLNVALSSSFLISLAFNFFFPLLLTCFEKTWWSVGWYGTAHVGIGSVVTNTESRTVEYKAVRGG